MKANFLNMPLLARFIWRRDRIRISVWLLSIVATTASVAVSYPSIYPPGPERDILAETLKNPAMTAMLGPGYGLADYHMGAIMAHQMLLFTALATAIMNILFAVRHTREDEERGRIEVIRSLPVGKLSNGGATLLVAVLVNLILALFTALALGFLPLEGLDWPGSFLYGAILGVSGIFFAAATVFFAQLTQTARSTLGLAFAFLGLSYLVRAIGDVSWETFSLISPLGLMLRSQVYVKNYWWPIFVLLTVTGFFSYLALKLNLDRDLEAGLIAAKRGRENASLFLQNPLGLVFRLQRVTIISWILGIFVLGTAYGSVFGELDAFFQTSDILELLLPGTEGFSLADQFVVTLLAVMGMIAAIPPLLILLKLRAEEQQNRTEHLLARSVSRDNVLGSYLLGAVLTSILVQMGAILGLWLATSTVLIEGYSLRWLLKGGLAYLPAHWIMLGLATILLGFLPKFGSFIWLYLGFTFFVIYFGGLLKLPVWLGKLTPFGYIPDVPLEPVGVLRIAALTLLALGFSLLGLIGYRWRDIAG